MKVKAGLIQMSLKGDTSMSPEEITCLEPSDFNRTVNVLMTSESTPVISKRPKGAWTHKIWEAMLALRGEALIPEAAQAASPHPSHVHQFLRVLAWKNTCEFV